MHFRNPVLLAFITVAIILGSCAIGIKLGYLPHGEYTTRK